MAHDEIALYPLILGPAWEQVDRTVRRAHLSGRVLRAQGVFAIKHGARPPARLIARLLLLPAESDSAPIHLEVTREGPGEHWSRTLGGRRMVTTQQASADGLLVERLGILEFHLRLGVVAGAITYSQEKACLRLGRWLVPLARWLAPAVSAREAAVRREGAVQVHVVITLPVVGPLLSYGGELVFEEANA
ncbi:MAG: DUF4166 domain-containing protein [Anaerolineae bacterium]